MKTIATLERVRQVHDELRMIGIQHPSAEAIIGHLGGGSKRTVLTHMKTVSKELAVAGTGREIPLEVLRGSAEKLTRTLWDAACAMAEAAHQSRFEMLLETQNARFEELLHAATVEEALRDQLQAATDRIEELEGQLRDRDRAEDHLVAIAAMLRTQGGPAHPPIVQLLRLLNAGGPRTRDDLLGLMVEAGHTRKQGRTALTEARERGYAAEGDDGVSITEAGSERLRNGRRRAS